MLRHSGSARAGIRLAQEAGKVTVEITDQGRGIPDDKLVAIQEGGSGVGLRGMRDRVRHLHGEMTVDSSGSGTTVSITLPTQSKAMPVAV